jgi:hypothetical protein
MYWKMVRVLTRLTHYDSSFWSSPLLSKAGVESKLLWILGIIDARLALKRRAGIRHASVGVDLQRLGD